MSDPATCPRCGYRLAQGNGLDAAVVDLVAQLERACRERDYWISADGRVSEFVAAQLLGRTSVTLRRWRVNGAPLPFYRNAGRITYRLREIAEFLESGREDDI